MERYFIKSKGALIPADEQAQETLRKIAEGEWLRVDVRRPRNLQQHRKLFAMLNIVLNNTEQFRSMNHLLCRLKIAVGHCEVIEVEGHEVYIPNSISFAAMPQDEFNEFYERACDWVVQEAIAISREELNQVVAEELAQMAI